MRIVSSLHEIGFSEESMSSNPTDWLGGVQAMRRVQVAADARIAVEGMGPQLLYQWTEQNFLRLLILA